MSDRLVCIDPAVGETIAAYETGLLEANARAAAEEHLARCESCRDALYEMGPYTAAIAAEPASVGRRVDELAREPGTSAAERLRTFLTSFLRRPAFVIAPVAAALALVLVLRDDGISSLARVEPVPRVGLPTRGPANVAQFTAGMEAYANGDWAEAAKRLAQVEAPDAEARFYLGLSRLLAGDADGAMEPLRAVAESESPVLSDRARWYLAQACLLRGERVEAENRLRDVVERSPVYAEDAAEILKELDGKR